MGTILRWVTWSLLFLILRTCELNAQATVHFSNRFFKEDSVAPFEFSKRDYVFKFGQLDNTYYERAIGGNDAPLKGLFWASEKRFFDSSDFQALVLADYFGRDTFLNVLWMVSKSDTLFQDVSWVDSLLLEKDWRSVAWELAYSDKVLTAVFDIHDVRLPISHCRFHTIHLYYGGRDQITLDIDGERAMGLNFDLCYDFILKEWEHIQQYHEVSCLKLKPMVTFELGVKNADMPEIRQFMVKLSQKGILMDVVLPFP